MNSVCDRCRFKDVCKSLKPEDRPINNSKSSCKAYQLDRERFEIEFCHQCYNAALVPDQGYGSRFYNSVCYCTLIRDFVYVYRESCEKGIKIPENKDNKVDSYYMRFLKNIPDEKGGKWRIFYPYVDFEREEVERVEIYTEKDIVLEHEKRWIIDKNGKEIVLHPKSCIEKHLPHEMRYCKETCRRGCVLYDPNEKILYVKEGCCKSRGNKIEARYRQRWGPACQILWQKIKGYK